VGRFAIYLEDNSMSEMPELEYWQNRAKLWEDKNKQLEEYLKDCREKNDTWSENADDTTQNMVVAKLKLFALKSRIEEANNIVLGKMKAARIGFTGISQKAAGGSYADGYNIGLSEGVVTTLLFVTELYRKAINTSEPLP
jgi:hypothetical protein